MTFRTKIDTIKNVVNGDGIFVVEFMREGRIFVSHHDISSLGDVKGPRVAEIDDILSRLSEETDHYLSQDSEDLEDSSSVGPH